MRSQLVASARESFRALGDAITSIKYTSITTGAYNATTGAPSVTRVSYTIDAVVEPVSIVNLQDDRVKIDDKLATFIGDDLGVPPKIGDELTIGGRVYRAVVIRGEVANIIWSVVVRLV